MIASLLLLCSATAGSPQLVVDGGLIPVDGAELFVGRFSIDLQATALAEDAGFEDEHCQLPTPEEWLAAAAQPGFGAGPSYDMVKGPWTEECRSSRADEEAMVEAEGVIFETHYYAAGEALDAGNGRGRFVAACASWPCEAENPLTAEPNPRTYRCVTRTPSAAKKRYVAASGINLRSGRNPAFPILDGADIGSPVDQLYTDGAWSYVTVKLHRNDCDYQAQGWVKDEFLSDSRPDRRALLTTGKAQLTAGQFAEAAKQLERAYAFDKSDRATRELLLEAYDGAGMKAEADKVRREAKKSTRRKRAR